MLPPALDSAPVGTSSRQRQDQCVRDNKVCRHGTCSFQSIQSVQSLTTIYIYNTVEICGIEMRQPQTAPQPKVDFNPKPGSPQAHWCKLFKPNQRTGFGWHLQVQGADCSAKPAVLCHAMPLCRSYWDDITLFMQPIMPQLQRFMTYDTVYIKLMNFQELSNSKIFQSRLESNAAKARQEKEKQSGKEQGDLSSDPAANQDIGRNSHGENCQVHRQCPVQNHGQKGACRVEVLPDLRVGGWMMVGGSQELVGACIATANCRSPIPSKGIL